MTIHDVEYLKRQILDLFGHLDKNKNDTELNNLLDLLELKVEKRLAPKQATAKKLGNPAVVGLGGFGVTTLLLQCYNFGWIKIGPILWLGVFYGGISQLIAGLMEYGNGNNFGFSAFTTYGAFWLTFAATNIANEYTKFTVDDTTMAFYLAAFGIYTTIMLVASTRHNLALTFVFATLAAGFWLLAAAHVFHEIIIIKMIGASVLTACALGALYVMSHLIMLESFGRNILPVGPPLHLIGKKTVENVAGYANGEVKNGDPLIHSNHYGVTLIQLNSKS